MKRKRWIIALALLSLAVQPPGAEGQRVPDFVAPLEPLCPKGDGWFAPDKLCHFGFSGVGAAGLYALGMQVGVPPVPAATGAVVIVATVGVLRETLAFADPDQLFTREHFSRRDLVWNGAGIVAGLVAAELWRWRKRRLHPTRREPPPGR